MGLAIQAPNDRYYVITRCGVVAVNGTLSTFDSLTGLPRPTYRDANKTIPNPTTMRLGPDGSPGFAVYWDIDDSLYRIEVRDAAGNLIDDNPNFPVVNSGGSGNVINLTLNASNYSLNPQFFFWSNGTSFDNDTLPVGSTQIADEWWFTRSNTDADITISQGTYPAGINLVPGTPPTYLLFTVTSASADGTCDISQRYQDVQTLNDQIVTKAIRLGTVSPGSSAEVQLICRQYFGTSGSTTIDTTIDTYTVNDTVQTFSSTFTVPSISGLTIGDGSYLELIFRFNPAQIQSVTVSGDQFQGGNGTADIYPYMTLDQQYADILPFEIAGNGDSQGTHIISSPDPTKNLYEYLIDLESNLDQQNFLIGWNFPYNPNQFGGTIDNTTTPNNNSGNYIADQTILLSDGNNIVSKDSFIGSSLTLIVETGTTKFGILQIIENLNCIALRGAIASLAARAFVSTGTPTLKIGILGWSGTLDQPTKNAVTLWNAAGTNPTLAAGWSFITVQSFTLGTTASDYFKIENITLNSSNNFGVLMWIDSNDMGIGDSIYFNNCGLNLGPVATPPVPLSFQETLSQCRRYFYKTYNVMDSRYAGYVTDYACYMFNVDWYASDVLIAPILNFPTNIGQNETINISTSRNYFTFIPPQIMFKAPTVTAYSPTVGTSGVATLSQDLTAGISFSAGSPQIPVNTVDVSENVVPFKYEPGTYSLHAQNSPGTYTVETAPVGEIHFTLNATIGV